MLLVLTGVSWWSLSLPGEPEQLILVSGWWAMASAMGKWPSIRGKLMGQLGQAVQGASWPARASCVGPCLAAWDKGPRALAGRLGK